MIVFNSLLFSMIPWIVIGLTYVFNGSKWSVMTFAVVSLVLCFCAGLCSLFIMSYSQKEKNNDAN